MRSSNLFTCITFDDISPSYITSSKLEKLIEFLNELGVRCTFFVVPSMLGKEFDSSLKMALAYGHELALHGYEHIKNEFGGFYPIPLPFSFPPFEKQKKLLEKGARKMQLLIGVNPLGFRAPFYLHNRATLRALSSLGFFYDSSATMFKPVHGSRLRLRWLHRFKPFVSDGVLEIPVSGDYTYNLGEGDFSSCLRRAVRDFSWIKSREGVFVLNNHPQRLGESGYLFLKTLVKKLSKQTEFSRLCDVSETLRC